MRPLERERVCVLQAYLEGIKVLVTFDLALASARLQGSSTGVAYRMEKLTIDTKTKKNQTLAPQGEH